MASDITIFWELVPDGTISPNTSLHLGDILIAPGVTTEKELKVYYSITGNYQKLTNCGIYLSPYTLPYPSPQTSSAHQDFMEVKRWGDLVGLNTPAGLLVNMNKSDGYPSADWKPINSQAGSSSYNRLILLKESIQLAGGGYHTVDGELPAGASAFFKIKVSVPAGVERVGYRYLSLVFEYESAV